MNRRVRGRLFVRELYGIRKYKEITIMAESLKGKVAIVTGAAGGYGAGIAETFKRHGAEVWITDIDEQALMATAERIGARGVLADAASSADWDALMEKVLAESSRLDILVNNAGGGVCIAPLEEQSDQAIERSIAINLTSKIFGSKRAAKIMKAQGGGTIINVSSICAKESWPGWSTYSAAQGGVVNMSQCLYTELRDCGVRVTTVFPSWGATKFTENSGLGPRDRETLARCIKPEELGELMLYIATLPPHLELLDATLLPSVQQIEPL